MTYYQFVGKKHLDLRHSVKLGMKNKEIEIIDLTHECQMSNVKKTSTKSNLPSFYCVLTLVHFQIIDMLDILESIQSLVPFSVFGPT
jgi:hypothetical protein